jgi:hypothetical protein
MQSEQLVGIAIAVAFGIAALPIGNGAIRTLLALLAFSCTIYFLGRYPWVSRRIVVFLTRDFVGLVICVAALGILLAMGAALHVGSTLSNSQAVTKPHSWYWAAAWGLCFGTVVEITRWVRMIAFSPSQGINYWLAALENLGFIVVWILLLRTIPGGTQVTNTLLGVGLAVLSQRTFVFGLGWWINYKLRANEGERE